MQLVPHGPKQGVYLAGDDYVHAMEVRGAERLLFVAGTMGLDPSGTPGTTLAEQLDLLWSNIRVILASADMTVDNIVRLTSYLRDASYAEANAAARVAALGRPSSPNDRRRCPDTRHRLAGRDRGDRGRMIAPAGIGLSLGRRHPGAPVIGRRPARERVAAAHPFTTLATVGNGVRRRAP